MVRELIALDPASKVWLYASERELSDEELGLARDMLERFLQEWTSHSRELMTYGNIFHRYFLGIFVDESMSPASGCSIDGSMRFVQQLSDALGVNFFQREYVYSLQDQEVKKWKLNELSNHYKSGEIENQTLFFDHLVPTKEAFISRWLVPLEKSWIKRFV